MVGKWHLGKAPSQIRAARRIRCATSRCSTGRAATGHDEFHCRVAAVGLHRGRALLKKLPEDYYATETYTDKLIDSSTPTVGDGKPFFAYFAPQAPHDRTTCRGSGALATVGEYEKVGRGAAGAA